MKTVTILVAVTVLFAPAGVTARQPTRPVASAPAQFPSRVGLFIRRGPVQRDRAGDPFAHYWAGSLVLASVYCYRTSGHSLQREYADCKDQVKIASPSARLISDSALSISGRRGKRAIFTARTGSLAAGGPAKSQLVMFIAGDRFLKFRITYPVAHADRAEEEAELFVRAFPWPKS